MKKLIIFLVAVIAVYLIYDNFIKENELVHVDASLVRVQESASLETPGVTARNYGHAEGTIKNLSDLPLKNIVINYMIDRQISTSTIYQLNPNEEVKFRTNPVMLRVMEPPFYLESVKYDQ
jgi:hypothetical protein